jgi:hypothetical protein
MEHFKLIEGKNPPAGTSRYYISKDHPLDPSNISSLKQLRLEDKYSAIMIDSEYVNSMHSQWIVEFCCAIQHESPELIERVFSKFAVCVENEKGKSAMKGDNISQYYYKDTKEYRKWMNGFYYIVPFMCFFLNDTADTLCFLMGDEMNDEFIISASETTEFKDVILTKEQEIQLNKKAFFSCKMLMEYCFTAGADPKKQIDDLIECFNLNFNYKAVEDSYNEMVDKGYTIEFIIPDAISDMNSTDESWSYKQSQKKTGNWLIDRKTKMLKDNDPMIKQYKTFDQYKKGRGTGVRLEIPIHTIVSKDPGGFLGSLMVIQHYPESLINLTKSFTFNIIDDNKNRIIEDKKWKSTAYYKEWLYTANTFFPPSFFFMRDLEDRYYALVGTVIEKEVYVPGEVKTKSVYGKKFTRTQLEFVFDRAFDGCVNFMQYCDAAGVDCRQSIKEMISSMSFPFAYSDVLESYEKGPSKKFIN